MDSEKKEPSFTRQLGIAFLFVFSAWYLGPPFIETFLGQFWGHNMGGNIRNPDQERFKPEETFAALNTLFSGLAFAAVAISLWYQRRDLQVQQKALVGQQQALEHEVRLLAMQHANAKLPKFWFRKHRFGWIVRNKGASVTNLDVQTLKEDVELDTLFTEGSEYIFGNEEELDLQTAQRSEPFGFKITCEVEGGAFVEIVYQAYHRADSIIQITSVQNCVRQIILQEKEFFDSLSQK